MGCVHAQVPEIHWACGGASLSHPKGNRKKRFYGHPLTLALPLSFPRMPSRWGGSLFLVLLTSSLCATSGTSLLRHHSARSAEASRSLRGGAEDEVLDNAPGVGGYGGLCTCPSGKVYGAGDNNDHCGSLACVGGKAGKCNRSRDVRVNGKWSRKKVTCGMGFAPRRRRRRRATSMGKIVDAGYLVPLILIALFVLLPVLGHCVSFYAPPGTTRFAAPDENTYYIRRYCFADNCAYGGEINEDRGPGVWPFLFSWGPAMGWAFCCTIILWCADIAMFASASVGGYSYPGFIFVSIFGFCGTGCLCGGLYSTERRDEEQEMTTEMEGKDGREGQVRGADTELEMGEMVNRMYVGGGAAAASEKKCPQGHDLTPHTTEGGRGTCDGCSRSLYHGTQVMQCFQCDFFICRSCSSKIDASETTAAERQAADNALTAIDQRQAAMRGRRVRKEDSLINAAAAEEKERQVRVKGMLVHV